MNWICREEIPALKTSPCRAGERAGRIEQHQLGRGVPIGTFFNLPLDCSGVAILKIPI